MLHQLGQDGTEDCTQHLKRWLQRGVSTLSSWYECFITQTDFRPCAVSEIYFWLAKTNCTLKKPQIEESVFGFLMPADHVSAQVTYIPVIEFL